MAAVPFATFCIYEFYIILDAGFNYLIFIMEHCYVFFVVEVRTEFLNII
jgi:hypothetical protein